MLTYEALTSGLAWTIAGSPVALASVLGLSSLIDRPLSERATSRLVASAITTGLLAALGVFGLMALRGTPHMSVQVGNWVVVPHYHFSFKLLFDYLSLPFAILSLVLCGTIGAFATSYLHREPGYNRFFFLYSLFVVGMVLTSLAGTIETLFTGWELVGLSSALLVAFFQERAMPVRNGLRVWSVYRVSDAAFLVAAVVLHHLRGEGDFDALLGVHAWPAGQTTLTSSQAMVIGFLLLIAAAGKSALVPFSGWLPRAMEGPTPSSAVFYGALSVHLGAYLLLRTGPMIAMSDLLCAAIVLLGLTTALYGAITSRAQTDIKSALSFASLTQVGVIVAEIGLGFRWIALAHIIGHASLRTLQFLRAPTILQDYRHLENAIGNALPQSSGIVGRFLPDAARIWLYRWAMERGYLDSFLNDFVARPFVRLFKKCDTWERRWTNYLAGRESRESDLLKPSSGTLEEIL